MFLIKLAAPNAERLKSFLSSIVLLTISPAEAKKVLSDGRNAHICQAGPSYWLPKICKYFEPIFFPIATSTFLSTCLPNSLIKRAILRL